MPLFVFLYLDIHECLGAYRKLYTQIETHNLQFNLRSKFVLMFVIIKEFCYDMAPSPLSLSNTRELKGKCNKCEDHTLIHISACSVSSQSMWIEWDWMGLNPKQVKLLKNFFQSNPIHVYWE
jgi:hypothetical protein